MHRFLIVIFSVLFIVSCTSKNQDLINRIKGLQKRVDSVESSVKRIELHKLKQMNEELSTTIQAIKVNFNEYRKLDSTDLKHIYAYKYLAKRVSRTCKTGGSSLESDIQLREKQLDHLKHDIKYNLLSDSLQINKYICLEEQAVNDLVNNYMRLERQFVSEKEHFYTLKDSVNIIIEKVKQNME